jgi:hypothetical protein
MSAGNKRLLHSADSKSVLSYSNRNNNDKTSLLLTANQKITDLKLKDEFSSFKKLPSICNQKFDIEIGDYKIDFNNFELFYGKFSNLPKQKSSIVKIFLSSTFSDYKVERNILYSIAFPKIREHCTSLDLEFQCVDMR